MCIVTNTTVLPINKFMCNFTNTFVLLINKFINKIYV